MSGIDPSMVSLVVQAYQNKRKERQAQVELGVNTGLAVGKMMQSAEDLKLKREKQEMEKQKLPSEIALEQSKADYYFVESQLKFEELESARQARLIGDILLKNMNDGQKYGMYKQTIDELESINIELGNSAAADGLRLLNQE